MKEKRVEVKAENVLTHDDFLAVSRRVHFNQYFADFYEKFAEEKAMPYMRSDGTIGYGKCEKYMQRGKSLRGCGKQWQFNVYPEQGYKNLVRVNRCRDRFCLNCQSVVANQRFVQYAPVLDELSHEYDVYHIVFTVPNVTDWRLADTVSLMLDRFAYLIRFFQGTKKIRGLDFGKYGYAGAVRSLEITVSMTNGTYHPHLHCMFLLKKGLEFPQVFWNSFSEDRRGRNPTRLFSEFELILQRMWCLLILRKEVTKSNIEHIGEICDYPDGFSVRADLSNGKYHEIFKYAIKGTFKNESLVTYENFLTLYKALFDRRCYQTFGVLRKYDFNEVDEDLGLTTPDEAFDMWLAQLNERELPLRVEEELEKILEVTKKDDGYKYISKATFARHFRALSEEDKLEALKKLQELEIRE